MRRSYRNIPVQRIAGAFFCSLFLLAGVVSCVDVDNTFGEEYIPHDHQAKVVRDESFLIKTYNVTSPDSLPASRMTYLLAGGYRDVQTGVSVDAGSAFQINLGYYTTPADSIYGVDPTVDSAFLSLVINDRVGKIDQEQTFDVYELTERIRYDSVYYYNFDIDPILSAAPLFSLTHSGDGASIRYRIENNEFLDRLLDTTGYWSDSLFKDRFKGFYMKPRISHEDAALYQLDMGGSGITVYYHNKNEVPDTSFVAYYTELVNVYGYMTSNQTINVIDRDYSGVYPEIGLDDEDRPASKTFVQSYGGVVTRLEFTEESVKAVKAKVAAAGYRTIAINRAKLEILYPARTPELLDEMHTRLGMYLDYAKSSGIADFNVNNELYYRTYQSSSYNLPYGGFVNRSRFLYEMDVTSYVQDLFKADYDKREVILGPTYSSDDPYLSSSYYRMFTSALSGYGSETPVRLAITYTMVR